MEKAMTPSEALEYIRGLPEAKGYQWDVGFENTAGELVVILTVGRRHFEHLIGIPTRRWPYKRMLRYAVRELLAQAKGRRRKATNRA